MADRIVYLISQFPTLSHSFILREIQELRRLGVTIDVASIRSPDRPAAEMTADEQHEANSTYYVRANWTQWSLAHGRTLIKAPVAYCSGLLLAVRSAKSDLARAIRHLRFFGEAVVVGDWMSRHRFTLLHTHFASLTAMLVQRIFRVSTSMTIHGSDEFIDPAGFCMAEKLRAASLVIGISRYGCSQIMRFCDSADWDKVVMVRLGINPEEFFPASDLPLRATFKVICVGRLVPVKAYRFLIRACASLLEQGEQIHLTIVGGGPERDALRALVESLHIEAHVEFTGPLPNHTVRERLQESDCFALASFAEGVPVALMEAMALGISCIATRVTGIPELIEDGREGILVPPADYASLAAAIQRLAHDPELRRRFASAGREKILRDYDLRQNIRTLRDHLLSRKLE